MSAHGYRSFLIFHSDGTHDLDRINRHLRKVSPLSPGHFHADTVDIDLGDLFSKDHLDFSSVDEVPNYIFDG
jgi:hypothetical protein